MVREGEKRGGEGREEKERGRKEKGGRGREDLPPKPYT